MKTKTNTTLFQAAVIATFLTLLFTAASVLGQTSNLNSLHYTNEMVGTAVGNGGAIMRSTDGGNTFFNQESGLSDNLLCVEMIDENTSVAVGENGVLIKSTDGGENWVSKETNTTEALNYICSFGTESFIVCGQNGTVLISNNNAETWAAVPITSSANFNYITFVDESVGFVVGSEGTVLKTVDGGNSFNATKVGNLEINSICMSDALNGILVGEAGLIMNTTDGGTEWVLSNTQFTEDFNDIVFNTATTVIPWVIAVGNNGQIALSFNGGFTWEALLSPVNENLDCIIFSTPGHGNITCDSTILETEDGGITWAPKTMSRANNMNLSNNSSSILAKDLQVNQNYPNPFNPSTVISYELPFSAQVSVKVYDIAGRQVADLTNAYLSTGNYSVTFNASSLASGLYFYRITAQSNSQKFAKTMKMLLVK